MTKETLFPVSPGAHLSRMVSETIKLLTSTFNPTQQGDTNSFPPHDCLNAAVNSPNTMSNAVTPSVFSLVFPHNKYFWKKKHL